MLGVGAVENLGVLFLFYIEEGLALAVLGPTLFGIRPTEKKIITIGVLQGIMIYLARNLELILKLPPFTHTVFLLITLIVIIKLVTGTGWGLASASSILGFIVIVVGEIIFVPLFYPMLGLTFEKQATSMWLHILIAYLGDILLFVLAIIVGLTKFSFIKPK